MQLANQSGESDQKMSPSIYAALINSLFTDPGPMFAGALCAAVAAIMTALKTGNMPAVAVRRAAGCHRRAARARHPSVPEGSFQPVGQRASRAGKCATSSARCSMPQRSGSGALVALMGSDDAVAHMIATSVTLCYVAAGGGRTYGRPWIFHVQMLLACGPLTVALAAHGSPYYVGMALLNVLFFLALKHISTSLQKIFVRALIGARARGGAGQPVRHGAQQHAAWPCDVPRRRAPGGDESPLQRDDGAVRRLRAARRRRRGHLFGLRRRRNDLGGERQADPAGSRAVRAPATSSRPIRTSARTGRCPGRSSRWTAAAPSCWSRTSPSARMRKPGSAIWRAMTN